MSAHARGRVGVAVLILCVPALAQAAVTAATALSFDPAQLSFGMHDGFDVVSLEGADFTTEPGEPMLPAVTVHLLLPPGAIAADLDVTSDAGIRVPGTYSIIDAPRPTTFSSEQTAEIPQRRTVIHGSVLPHSRGIVRPAGVGFWGGHSVATVIVTPLEYAPETGELVLHRTIEIRATALFENDARAGDSPTAGPRGNARVSSDAAPLACPGPGAAARAAVRAAVANPGALAAYPEAGPSSGRGGDVDYLIICPESLESAFAPLAAWKTMKGVRAEIVTLEDIYADPAYAGVDAAAEIRNCIAQKYAADGVSWVLLGGDTDLLPARLAYDFFYNQGLPCDLYYADLDGSWNGDGDSRWGEQGQDGIDMYSDVFVGRAPVGSANEAAAFVEKVLLYEGGLSGLPDDYELDMLFLGEVMWSAPDPYTDGAVALDLVDSNYVPPRFDPITKLYESAGDLSASSALSALGNGYGIVMHEGHSSIATAGVGPDALTIPHLDALSNAPRAGLWYSVGCWSAAIDHDTFGEHWVTDPDGGGVAYVGNSRYGWGCPGLPGQCVSDLYSQQFMNSLLVKDLVHAGLVHADAKHHYVGASRTDNYMRYAMYELNLLGDPEMPVWTDAPGALSVGHPSSVPLGAPDEIEVVVTGGGAPVPGATVCACAPDIGVYAVGQTDAAGRAVLAVEPAGEGTVTLTVTAKNRIPYSASVEVSEAVGVVDAPVTALFQNSPNPFAASTEVAFALGVGSRVSISVYDVSGRRVAVLTDGERGAGRHSVVWHGLDEQGRSVAAGTYFVRMVAGASRFDRKITVFK